MVEALKTSMRRPQVQIDTRVFAIERRFDRDVGFVANPWF